MNITIIGAGSWGCGLAKILSDNSHNVMLYDLDKQAVDNINNFHKCAKLPDGKLPENVFATNKLITALDFSTIIIICLPTKAIRAVLKEINKNLADKKLFVNTSKGVEPDSLKCVSEIVREEIDSAYIKGYVALCGPTHAEEVIEQKLTLASSVSENYEDAKVIQKLFSNETYFRVYTSDDVIGTELCSAVKNVYALASGMLEGLGYGDNAKAGLISRALLEIRQIVLAFGGKESSIFGLTGIGDLIATCMSPHSRNYQAGIQLAKGSNIDEAVSSVHMVVEGVRTAMSIHQACVKHKLNCPIIEAIYNVVYLKHDVKSELGLLMKHELRAE